jgi:zinc protease
VLTVQAEVVTSHTALAFELLADAVLRPALPADGLELLRRQTSEGIVAGLNDQGTLGARIFLLAGYQRSPYAQRPTPGSIAAIKREDLLAFWQARFRPAGAVLVIAGDLSLADARRLTSKAFGAWKGLRPAPLPPAPKPRTPSGIVLVHQPGAQTATILVGGTTFPGNDSSYYAVAVLSRLLGDERSGRLVRALGGEHPWSTTAGASFLRTRALGLFQTTALVPVEVADSALREMYTQLARVRTDLVPARELGRAREYVAGSYAVGLQSASEVAAGLTEVTVLGLPAAYAGSYRTRVLAVTAAQVRAAARRVFPATGVVTVVVGDAARLLKPLSAVAPVQLFAEDGRVLTAAEIEPKAGELRFGLSSITGRTDTLAIVAQGQTVGLQVTQLTRAGDSLVYVERTALGTALNQRTTLVFDTAGRMRRLDQTGTARGKETRIQLAYAGGRVRGTVQAAGTTGPTAFTVDTAVNPAVLDDNSVQAVLPLLPWAVNTRWELEVFVSGENAIRRLTLTAADEAPVAIQGTMVDCYRADLEGGQQRVSFYVTKAAPHRVVRVELASSPVVFVAISP